MLHLTDSAPRSLIRNWASGARQEFTTDSPDALGSEAETKTMTFVKTRWQMLALLFLARVGMGLQFQTLASVSDDLGAAFGLDYAEIGLLIGVFMAPGLVLALPAGFAGRFFSDQMLSVVGMLALCLGGLISGSATESWAVGLGRAVAGAGFLLGTLYFTKMVADWFTGKEIATAMSVLVMSWPFGIAMGQIGHVWLAEAYGWRVPFHVASAYCLIFAIGVFLFYEAPGARKFAKVVGSFRLDPREWRLIVCAGVAWGVYNAGYVIYLSFGPQVLQAQGQSALSAAGVISVASWLMIGSGALCGQIADRYRNRNLILMVCMSGAIFSLALLSLTDKPLLASILFGVVGMAPAGVIMALAGEALRPEARAFGMGVFFTIYHAIVMTAPPGAGALLDATGVAGAPIILGMTLFAVVVPATLFYRRFQAAMPAPSSRADAVAPAKE